MSEPINSRVFSYGILSDPQYVDSVDGSNYQKTSIRRHRQSLQTLKQASKCFLGDKTACNVVLGDILDGKAESMKIHQKCIEDVFAETVKHSPNWHFVTGNHDLYCFPRDILQEKFMPKDIRLSVKDQFRLYYDFSPYQGYRFVILDAFDVSDISASNPENETLAKALLTANNANYASGNDDWYFGLTDSQKRFCPSNGGIGTGQLRWLKRTLQAALHDGEKCIVCCHIPTYGPSTRPDTLLFNAEEVLGVLQSYPNVIAYMAGHDHSGGYALDPSGIHHLVPPAPLECAEGEVSYGTVDVFESHLQLNWTGKVPDRTPWPTHLPIRKG